MLSHFSCLQLFATLWTVALQALLWVGFSRQEYRNGLPFSFLQGVFQSQESNPCLLWLLHCRQILDCWATGGEGEVAQSCPTLCDPVDCNLLGFSDHGILQVRIPEWIAISFSRGSSRPRDWTQVSCIVNRHFAVWATRVGLRLVPLTGSQGSCLGTHVRI